MGRGCRWDLGAATGAGGWRWHEDRKQPAADLPHACALALWRSQGAAKGHVALVKGIDEGLPAFTATHALRPSELLVAERGRESTRQDTVLAY